MNRDQLEMIVGRLERDVRRIDEAVTCARILLQSPPSAPPKQEAPEKPAKRA